MTQPPRFRITGLLTLTIALAFLAFGVPNRLLAQWSYSIERGRLAAGREEIASAEQLGSAFRTVARVARPAVVQLTAVTGGEEVAEQLAANAEKRLEIAERWEAMRKARGDEKELGELLSEMRRLGIERSALLQKQQENSGSGIIIDERGYILTNRHVVGGDDPVTKLRVRTSDDRDHDAQIVGADSKTDLAVVKIDAEGLHPLPLGDSDKMEVGDWVLAVGAPFGLSQTVTHGIISAKGRTDIDTGGEIFYQDFLQTDAAINPGNSGGPLINLRGEVVGVNTAIMTNNRNQNAGVAFTIPSNLARRVAEQLIKDGKVKRGWLGISLTEVTDADAPVLGLKETAGVAVAILYEDTAATRAGLLVDDVILAVNDVAVTNIRRLQSVIAGILPGDAAQVRVLRDGEERVIEVKLDAQPENMDRYIAEKRGNAIRARELDRLPLRLRTLMPSSPASTAETLHIGRNRRGVVVDSLIESRNAAAYNIDAGDLITAVNDQEVKNLGELAKIVQAAGAKEALRLAIVRPDGKTRTVEVRE